MIPMVTTEGCQVHTCSSSFEYSRVRPQRRKKIQYMYTVYKVQRYCRPASTYKGPLIDTQPISISNIRISLVTMSYSGRLYDSSWPYCELSSETYILLQGPSVKSRSHQTICSQQRRNSSFYASLDGCCGNTKCLGTIYQHGPQQRGSQ